MCPPDVGATIGPDVFIGCPEGSVIGGIEHCRAVIPYPKTDEEKAATRSDGLGGKCPIGIEVAPRPSIAATVGRGI
jgi:hypothetical protein